MSNFKTIQADLYRYTGRKRMFAFFIKCLTHPGARFIFLFRMCNMFSKFNPIGFFFRVLYKLNLVQNGCEIPHNCELGSGLYLGHFKAIVINGNSKIGSNCNIMQSVTIGNESRGQRKGAPIIGNKVLIGPNSVISGRITVGNNVLIAPLTFVNFDVPDNSVVIGNPAKIISSSGSEGYINKILPSSI